MNVTSSMTFSSDVIASTNCATSSLVLSARPGQRLNLSLTDFHSHDVTGASPACHNYLQLTDVTSDDAMTVCAGVPRERRLMSTVGHSARIKFQVHNPNQQRFILHAQGLVYLIQNISDYTCSRSYFQRSDAVTYQLQQVAGRSATVTSRRWVVTRASTRGSWSVLETCGRDRSAVAARRIER